MYNQALILMRCVVAAEEYSMARHALPPIPATSQQSAATSETLWAGAQRSDSDGVSPRGAKTDHPGVTRT